MDPFHGEKTHEQLVALSATTCGANVSSSLTLHAVRAALTSVPYESRYAQPTGARVAIAPCGYLPVLELRMAGARHSLPFRVLAPHRGAVDGSPTGFPCFNLLRLLSSPCSSPIMRPSYAPNL